MSFTLQSVLDHFGLKKRPFTLLPDPAFLYMSPQHLNAQSILDYGIASRAPITLVTGEIGAGKTTLLRDLLGRTPDDIHIGMIANAAPADRVEMLRLVLISLGVQASETDSYAILYTQLEAFVVEEYRAGRRVLLVFDEAQNLDRSSLEHLRMLTNINYAEHELIQLLLIGQPELLETVRRPDLAQLAQRISANVFLSGLSESDVEHYIVRRLEIAGLDREVFEPDTYKLIHGITRGVPRIVNQVCDYALLYAYSNDDQTVSIEVIEKVFEDGFILSVSRDTPVSLVPKESKSEQRKLK
tara:strand:- start:63103 stop:63999 length:897 start_codon:yes stop_codon:yes gene_type:complete